MMSKTDPGVAEMEMQQYLYAVVTARNNPPLNKTHLERFIDKFFQQPDANHTGVSSDTLSRGDTHYMTRTSEAVEFFLEFCILIFAKAYGVAPSRQPEIKSALFGRKAEEQSRLLSTALPRTMWEDKKRIRIALLRFQLYCELFHCPHSSETEITLGWEDDLPAQEAFWLRYEWWEVEEVKCLYQVLLFSFENSDVSSTESFDVAPEHGNHDERGLTQLRHFVDDSVARPTVFGNFYLHQFLSKPFHGFKQNDPEDYGYFSLRRPTYRRYYLSAGVEPSGTYRTMPDKMDHSRDILYKGKGPNRKWPPSSYPGVELEYFTDLKRLPIECKLVNRDAAEVRKFLRLIGWVFWRRDKIYDWLEFDKTFGTFRLEAGDFDEEWDAPRGMYERKPFKWSQHEDDCGGSDRKKLFLSV